MTGCMIQNCGVVCFFIFFLSSTLVLVSRDEADAGGEKEKIERSRARCVGKHAGGNRGEAVEW